MHPLILSLLLSLQTAAALLAQPAGVNDNVRPFPVNTITEKGAWCWFADPRALHYENESGTINSTYIGYIDVQGYIKATQIDHLHNRRSEVLIRSWFQPDDHNNPTFLVLPDERIMIFYARHTDEPCFYYRVSREPGDITTLGNEMRLATDHATTYPSPFLLSDDPAHIYLCWRGIGWHPTIGRLTLPDSEDQVSFDWGPFQIIRSMNGAGGVRPYAKYATNGKEKIYLAYTTTHPDNQTTNWIYLNCFDILTKALTDIGGNQLSVVGSSPLHEVDITPAYREKHPLAVVDDSPLRNWIWELTLDQNEHPVMATVGISPDKSSHDYYHIRWRGHRWQKTFLANAGGHFHQSPDIEQCYSGGMAIDKYNPLIIYGSVPVVGRQGKVYELKRFTVAPDGASVSEEQLTFHSLKNNVRPFVMGGKTAAPALVWMQGDYYDWIVSATRPLGYPTAIRTNITIPQSDIALKKGLIYSKSAVKVSDANRLKITLPASKEFTIALRLTPSETTYHGDILTFAGVTYTLPEEEVATPLLKVGNSSYMSSNILGNADRWKEKTRSTNGQWYLPVRPSTFRLVITYEQNTLRTYIDGLIDQSVEIGDLLLTNILAGGVSGVMEEVRIYNRALTQDEIEAQ